ncbi:MAG: universal stress protein [Deferrisomatales bacterium]
MFRHALVATDLSSASKRITECAGQLRTLGCEAITLVHVEEVRYSVGLEESLAEADRPQLEAQAQALEAQGYRVDRQLRRGIAWHEILEATREAGADLVMVASHGRGSLAETVLGGTAARVVESSPVPVLVLRLSLMEAEGGRYCSLRFARVLDHVLHPTDFSEGARRAFAVLQGLAGRAGRITLLHVNAKGLWEHVAPEIPKEYADEDASRLAELAEVLRDAGCPEVREEIAEGDPRKEILARAAEEKVSLILMGTSGWGGLPELLLGSTAHALVRRAGAPVLLVRG